MSAQNPKAHVFTGLLVTRKAIVNVQWHWNSGIHGNLWSSGAHAPTVYSINPWAEGESVCCGAVEGWEIAESHLHRQASASLPLLEVITGTSRDPRHQWEKKMHVCLHVLQSWNTLTSTLSFNQKSLDEPVVPPPPPHLWLPQASQKFSVGADEHVSCMMEENVPNFYHTDYSWRFKCDPGQWFL